MATNKIRPKSVADIRQRFLKNVQMLVETGKNMEDALRNKKQVVQHKIDKNGWTGDTFDTAGMGKPWDRKEHHDDMVAAIKNAASPGVVGDLMSTVLQGDWLATQERAFRARHMSKIRASVHAGARRRGHGDDAGVFAKGTVNYIKNLVKMSKDVR